MVLRKNIYGSPLAFKNWAKERNNYFLHEMPDIIGGRVIQMVYETCMFMIIIEEAGVAKYSYFVVICGREKFPGKIGENKFILYFSSVCR